MSRQPATASQALEPASPEADPGALALLSGLWDAQEGLHRDQALAWERVIFAEAFAGPEPARRVGAFLGGAEKGR